MSEAPSKLSFSIVRQGMAYARQQGVPVDAILAAHELDLQPIASDPAHIELTKLERALELLWLAQPERRYPCLRDSELMGRSVFGPITQLFLNAPSVGAAAQDLREFEGLFGNPGKLVFEHQPGNLFIEWRPGFTIPMVRENIADFLLGSVLLILRTITTPQPLPLRYVMLRRPRPASSSDVELYTSAYGCEVRFDSDTDALVLAPETLSMRSYIGDGHAYQEMRQLFRRMVMAIAVPHTFSETVRDTIRGMDWRVGISRKTVAEKLGISERKLNRALAAEGLTYLEIAEGLRYSRAAEYLVSDSVGLQEVAAELGFGESTSFSRWFRKMAGISPSEFRNRSAVQGKT